jgi:hypothetical protein
MAHSYSSHDDLRTGSSQNDAHTGPAWVAPRNGGPLERESAAGLFSRLMSDATALLRNELALAKAELSSAASHLKAGLIALALGAVVLVAALLSLLAAVILALAQVVEPWLSALIIGVALAIAGLLMLQGARKKLQPSNLEMERTQTALKRVVAVVARRT